MAEKKVSIKKQTRTAKSKDAKARDSFQNFALKLGLNTDNALAYSSYGFNPITRNRQLLEWVYRGSWLGGAAVDTMANDLTRTGVTVQTQLKPEKVSAINRMAVDLSIWKQLNKGAKWGRLYGGALGVMLVDGQDFKTPLRDETIGGKSKFKGVMVLDRWMVEPSLEDLVTEYGTEMAMPKFYTVVADAPGLRGQRIHHSRVIRFEGLEIPYWQAMTENMWSISVLERLYDRLVGFDSATMGAAQLTYKSFIRTYKVKGLRDIVAEGGEALKGLTAYVDMMRRFQSSEGITLLDDEDSLEALQAQGFSGLADVLLQLGQQVSGATGIPLVRLFGQSPAGLNSTGESDMRNYYDGVRQIQDNDYKVPVTRIYKAMARTLGYSIKDEEFDVQWNPLWQMTDKEKAEVAQSKTSTITQAEEAALISPKVAAMELREVSRSTGVFTNISDEDIEAMEEDVPAPEELGPSSSDTSTIPKDSSPKDLKDPVKTMDFARATWGYVVEQCKNLSQATSSEWKVLKAYVGPKERLVYRLFNQSTLVREGSLAEVTEAIDKKVDELTKSLGLDKTMDSDIPAPPKYDPPKVGGSTISNNRNYKSTEGRIKYDLQWHTDRMKVLMEHGLSREEASSRAMSEMKKTRDDSKAIRAFVRDSALRAQLDMKRFHDLDVVIENPVGSVRTGSYGQSVMASDYGYIRLTHGADGDQVDCHVGPSHESRAVWIIDQKNTIDDSFDEHKVLLGFQSEKEAVTVYGQNYINGSGFIGAVTQCSMEELKRWLAKGDFHSPYSAEFKKGYAHDADTGQDEIRKAWEKLTVEQRINYFRSADASTKRATELANMRWDELPEAWKPKHISAFKR